MHFGFALELSDIDLWNINLLDTHLDLLDTDIPSKHFVCLHNVFKTSWRHVFKTSSINVFKTSSRHVFKTSSRYVFNTSLRRLQRNNFSLRYLEDMSWRRLSLFTDNLLKNVWKNDFKFFVWSSLKIQTTISSSIWLLIQWFLCRSTAVYCP